MDNNLASPIVDDKQQVFDTLKQVNHVPAAVITRRTFCTFTGLSLISFFLSGCSGSESNTNLKAISREDEFNLFFDVIFPASDLGLNKYRETALSRIQRQTGKNATLITQTYKRFKRILWLKSDLGTKSYSKKMGEACMIALMHSKYAEQCNLALDIIYYELSKDNRLLTALWGRRFSLNDKKCVYWDNYDQAVS